MPETQISAYTLGFEWPDSWGASGKVYFWASRDFSDVDGRRYLGATAGNMSAMLRSVEVSVEGGVATLGDVSLPKTTNPQSGGPAKITGWIYDARGNKVEEFFSGHINHALGDATNWPAVFIDNACKPRRLADRYATVAYVLALLQAVVYALASAVEYGRVRVDETPDDSADPVAVGLNSPRARLRANGRATLVGGSAVVGSSLVTATSNVLLTGQDDNVSGALRVSERDAGVSFTIASTNGADSGVVGWAIFDPD